MMKEKEMVSAAQQGGGTRGTHELLTASPSPPLGKGGDTTAEERTKSFADFAYIVRGALRLDTVRAGSYRSTQLWTPAAQRTVYGGQLVAHVVEAAYRTVDESHMHIHSLRISFIAPGSSRPERGPIEYTVESLRDGRSFCLRQVRAVQDGRTLLLAVAGFHKAEHAGLRHELAPPHFVKGTPNAPATAMPAAFESRLAALLRERAGGVVGPCAVSSRGNETDPSAADAAAGVEYMNLSAVGGAAGGARRALAEDVWVRLSAPALALLSSESGIPSFRLHLIIACWLSDFIVALASLMPHGLPNPDLRMIASLDHAIYFHNPQRIRVDDWFAYEVRSSWAGNNRGLNHGRMYGRDGRLWMSVAQETVIRMRSGYVSKL